MWDLFYFVYLISLWQIVLWHLCCLLIHWFLWCCLHRTGSIFINCVQYIVLSQPSVLFPAITSYLQMPGPQYGPETGLDCESRILLTFSRVVPVVISLLQWLNMVSDYEEFLWVTFPGGQQCRQMPPWKIVQQSEKVCDSLLGVATTYWCDESSPPGRLALAFFFFSLEACDIKNRQLLL